MIKLVTATQLSQFKAQWPGHGFPPDMTHVYFVFESNGDLADIEAFSHGKPLDTSEFDGPALLALSHDAQINGLTVRGQS